MERERIINLYTSINLQLLMRGHNMNLIFSWFFYLRYIYSQCYFSVYLFWLNTIDKIRSTDSVLLVFRGLGLAG